VDETIAELAGQHAAWSPDRLRATLPFLFLATDLRDVAIACRFALDDPEELGRGLAILGRLRWLEGLIGREAVADAGPVLEAFAARDVEAALRLADGEPSVSQAADGEELEFLDLLTLAVVAACRGDYPALGSVVRRMGASTLFPWQEGIRGCLAGLAGRRANEVAGGLSRLLEGMRRLRRKDELDEAVCLAAHGLYRLCERASPNLVAGIDAAEPIPWDAGFHAWSEAHPDGLAGVDLTGISPVLHEAVVRLRPPGSWATQPSP
jgi:hypothetical protein